jgi:hypothetical protein
MSGQGNAVAMARFFVCLFCASSSACLACAVLLIVLAWRAFFQEGRGIGSNYQKGKSNFQNRGNRD